MPILVGEGNGTPLQYSCLETPMDGGAWWAAVHGVTKSRTRLSDFTFTFHFHALEKEMATHSSVFAWRIPWTHGVTKSQTRVSDLHFTSIKIAPPSLAVQIQGWAVLGHKSSASLSPFETPLKGDPSNSAPHSIRCGLCNRPMPLLSPCCCCCCC